MGVFGLLSLSSGLFVPCEDQWRQRTAHRSALHGVTRQARCAIAPANCSRGMARCAGRSFRYSAALQREAHHRFPSTSWSIIEMSARRYFCHRSGRRLAMCSQYPAINLNAFFQVGDRRYDMALFFQAKRAHGQLPRQCPLPDVS